MAFTGAGGQKLVRIGASNVTLSLGDGAHPLVGYYAIADGLFYAAPEGDKAGLSGWARIGFADDRKPIAARYRLPAQFILAGIAIGLGGALAATRT